MNPQRGNILFLILLAVILFAALSYAVTSSMRGGGKDANSESVEMGAASILQWFTGLDNAVLRMYMSGTSYEKISFIYNAKYYDGSPLSNYMDNATCSDDTCRVFKPTGGGVVSPDFLRYGTPSPTGVTGSDRAPGTFYLRMMQWPGAGTDKNDVVLSMFYMKPEICSKINASLGVTDIPVFTGTFVYGNVPADWDNSAETFTTNAAQLYGKNTVSTAVAGSGSGSYCRILHLVIAR